MGVGRTHLRDSQHSLVSGIPARGGLGDGSAALSSKVCVLSPNEPLGQAKVLTEVVEGDLERRAEEGDVESVWPGGGCCRSPHRSSLVNLPPRKAAPVPWSSCSQETDGEAEPSNIMDWRGHWTMPGSAATWGAGCWHMAFRCQPSGIALPAESCLARDHIPSQGSQHPMTGQRGNTPNLGHVRRLILEPELSVRLAKAVTGPASQLDIFPRPLLLQGY